MILNINNIKYYDSASTTPVDSRVKDAMMPYFDEIYGNASSNHYYGKEAKQAIDKARDNVAKIINSTQKEIYFTSGSTESINWALKGYLEGNPENGNHIITVKTEHKAVLSTCEYLETKGYEVTYLDVDNNGLIDFSELNNAITINTALIAIMYVNNEIGIIQDVEQIGKIAKENNICFFCDATQAVGKIQVDVFKNNIDLLCFSAHKMNGPKGIGALFVKNTVRLTPLIHGGSQERGQRGGTYNTPLIVGFGKACEISILEFNSRGAIIQEKRKEIFDMLKGQDVIENFLEVTKVSNIISLTILEEDSDMFLIRNSFFFVASTGSACNSRLIETSHVIQNVFPENLHNKVIRISI